MSALRTCALLFLLPLSHALLIDDRAALGAAWSVCEAQSAAECDADRCTLCDRLDGAKLCFTPETAAKLPPFAFRCASPDATGAAELESQAVGKPEPWQVCEALKASACDADRCSLCTKLDGSSICFTPSTAAKLPAFAFKCTHPKPAEAAALLAPPAPWEVCETLNATECSAQSDRCDLCAVAMTGKKMCFEPEIAAKLPAGIFTCTGAAPAPPAAGAGEEAAAKLLKPMPKVICEMLDASECAADAEDCALCTNNMSGKQLCFRPDVAAGLSPYAFKCSGAEPQAAIATQSAAAKSVGRRAGPVDPQQEAVCENVAAADCAAQEGCTACTRIDGWEQCFSSELAAKLSPYAYRCNGKAQQLSASADTKPKPAPKPWVPCESYTGAECAKAKGCVLCAPPSGAAICFQDSIAAKLPPGIFTCSKPKEDDVAALAAADEAEEGTKPAPGPFMPCEASLPADCDETKCSLCTLAKSGKQLCFDFKIAAKLPAGIFTCSKPTYAAANTAADEAKEGTKPAPGPFMPCEASLPADCDETKCSLCTLAKSGKQLCFDFKIAAKLPAGIFTCSKPTYAAANTATDDAEEGTKPAPGPFMPCEASLPADCDETKCSLCTLAKSGKQLCFDFKIAAKLPPGIFTCSKPTYAAAAADDSGDAEAGAKPAPEPWVPCEASAAADCDDAKCSLCTLGTGKQLCFNPTVAAKLPATFFKCTKPKAADA